MLILFIIVYNRESVSVGRSAWFSRFLKIEFWTHGKVHDSRGGRRARARPRAFRKRAARKRQIFVICRPPATMIVRALSHPTSTRACGALSEPGVKNMRCTCVLIKIDRIEFAYTFRYCLVSDALLHYR